MSEENTILELSQDHMVKPGGASIIKKIYNIIGVFSSNNKKKSTFSDIRRPSLLKKTALMEGIEEKHKVKYISFSFYLVALAAKLSAIEDPDQDKKIQKFYSRFPMYGHTVLDVRNLFTSAIKDPMTSEYYAIKIKDLFPSKVNLRREILQLLVYIADTNDYITRNEMKFIYSIGKIFSISVAGIKIMLSKYLMSNDTHPYKILGIGKSVNKEELSFLFKKLVKEYHPDRFTHKSNIAQEYADVMKHKFDQIKRAYEFVLKDKKF